jgi:hypothetical protein
VRGLPEGRPRQPVLRQAGRLQQVPHVHQQGRPQAR